MYISIHARRKLCCEMSHFFLIGSYDRSCVHRAGLCRAPGLELQMCPSSRYPALASPIPQVLSVSTGQVGRSRRRRRPRPSIYVATSLSGEICPPSLPPSLVIGAQADKDGHFSRREDKAVRCLHGRQFLQWHWNHMCQQRMFSQRRA